MALQVSKVAWIEICLGVSQTTHDLYGLIFGFAGIMLQNELTISL
jgi:hypothetical protein